MTVQKDFARAWAHSDPNANIHTIPTIQEAIELAQEFSEGLEETQIFVTGSLHLVGGVLSFLEGTSIPSRS